MDDEMDEIKAGLDEYYEEIRQEEIDLEMEDDYYHGLDDPYSGADYFDDPFIDEEYDVGKDPKTAKIGDVNIIADYYQPLDLSGFSVLQNINRDKDYKLYESVFLPNNHYLKISLRHFFKDGESFNPYNSSLVFFDHNRVDSRSIEEIVLFKTCMNVE